MMYYDNDSKLAQDVHVFILEHALADTSRVVSWDSNPLWAALRQLGTQLWLDTGSISHIKKYWSPEFSALTTNNTLLNKEVQTGQYDDLILRAAALLDGFPNLSERQKMLEIAFILNAVHGLRLVKSFDAFVSVEEHTDLAHDIDAAVTYACRFHAIHPTRFIVKIPFTPEGLLATRKIWGLGIAVNHTLNFSARQNYLIARIGKPAFVNVFLGRLNSFVTANKLGSGDYIGEKAALASQVMLRDLRRQFGLKTLQIGASFRSGRQVADLMGLDVMTMPPDTAQEFLALGLHKEQIQDKTKMDYRPGVADPKCIKTARLDTLWDVPDELIGCVDRFENEDLDNFDADGLYEFFDNHGCGDILVRWTDDQAAVSRQEGKIPKLSNWQDLLASKKIGLDALMNLAGLNSFKMDQQAMDNRVRGVLAKR